MNISVVIPSYNRAKTITSCLDSVCNQTVPPLEVIVVDDCSTDATVELVNKYSRSHPSVRCLALDRNSGAQMARNRGIKEASGEWIAFQDSDDEWVSDKLEKQIAALSVTGGDLMTVVHTDCYRYDHQALAKSLWALPHIDGENVLRELLTTAGPMFQGMMTSKLALEKIGLLDEKVPSYQEWDTAIRLARECRFIHLQEPLFVYHLHIEDTISKDKKKDIDGYQYVIDKHRDEIIELCGADTLNRHLENNALRAMHWGFYPEASRILAKTVGGCARNKFLKVLARMEISPRLYGFAARVVRRLRHQ